MEEVLDLEEVPAAPRRDVHEVFTSLFPNIEVRHHHNKDSSSPSVKYVGIRARTAAERLAEAKMIISVGTR